MAVNLDCTVKRSEFVQLEEILDSELMSRQCSGGGFSKRVMCRKRGEKQAFRTRCKGQLEEQNVTGAATVRFRMKIEDVK